MKNVAVGKKIFFGFGGVILLIVVILVVTMVTSISRNTQLEEVNLKNDMLTEANAMLDRFNLARVEIRTVFTSVDNAAEYAAADEYLDQVFDQLDVLKQYSAQLDGYAADANAELDRLLTQLDRNFETVHANDLAVLDEIAELTAASQNMAEQSVILSDLAESVSEERARRGGQQAVNYIENVLIPIVDLNTEVDSLRILGSYIILNQDLSRTDEINTALNSIEQRVDSLATAVTTPDGVAAQQALREAVAAYREAMEQTVQLVQISDTEIAAARALFLEVSDTINAGVTQISDDVNTIIEDLAAVSNSVMLILLFITIIAIAGAVAIAFVLGRMITVPLGKMKDVLVQVGTTGNLQFSDEVRNDIQKEAEAKDEIGQSLQACSILIDRIRYVGDTLEQIAARDLSVDVQLLTSEDTMGVALDTMVTNLNEMFAEINSVSSQVATSSGEIAQGAQSLAQGSTEQASTVEEISASVNEINGQMDTSSNTAHEAADHSTQISSIAQEGSQKMGSMMQAVQEINDASNAIGQVIKVIDDIAFQTNILALNAAVEAARAGEHGKGFAVVADEVRNLAGKSADAAKETATLISANIEKAELGLSISQETAETLSKIVEGIEQTSESLQTIASQSEAAKAATAQVNLAVDQVAQVVQQNSATSEESAAASEEMSSQAQVLQQLIARFKLRDASEAIAPQLPQAMAAPQLQTTQSYDNDIIF